MRFFTEFFNQYATVLLYGLLTALGGMAGVVLKRLYNRHVRDQTKKRVVEDCIRAVEEVYKDQSREEQYQEMVRAVSESLAGKGIRIAEVEAMLRVREAQSEAAKRGA